MSTGETVQYQGRSEQGVHTFVAGSHTVTAAKGVGWQCDCGQAECEHIRAAKAFWREQSGRNTAAAATGGDNPQPGAGPVAQASAAPVRSDPVMRATLPVVSAAPRDETPEWGDEVHLLNLVATLAEHVARVADALEKLVGHRGLAAPTQPFVAAESSETPDLEYPLSVYAGFDWTSIGAQLVSEDQDGATVVRWRGQLFKRRSPDNKFGKAIWFSRTTGKAEDGTPLYERLISFREISEPDPLPSKVAAKVAAPNGNGRH
jgi:hypothetical protein